MSKKAKAKPEPVDEFAEYNARCVEAIDTIEYYTRQYRKPGEPITECVMRLLVEVTQFRAEETHRDYIHILEKRREAEKGGAR